MPRHTSEPLLPLRAAVILALALIAGTAASAMTYLVSTSAPAALLSGGAATGSALMLFDNIIGS
jgi:hypothetical protein